MSGSRCLTETGDKEKERQGERMMGRVPVLSILLVSLSPCLLVWKGGSATGESRLAVIRAAPDFTLTTQARETLRLRDLSGKVVLVSFVFTSCNGTCPAT